MLSPMVAAVRLDELFALHKHAARAATGVATLPVMQASIGDQQSAMHSRRVELPPFLPSALANWPRVFVDLAEDVAPMLTSAQPTVETDQRARRACPAVAGRGRSAVEDALRRAFSLSIVGKRVVDALADVALLAAARRLSQRAASGTQNTLASR